MILRSAPLIVLLFAPLAAFAKPGHEKPRISMEQARKAALDRVPGKVRSAELETEQSRLLYSFDIKVKSKPGIEEVHVDAHSGAVLDVSHEGPADERRESAEDAAKSKR